MKIASGGPKVGVAVPPLGKSWGGTCPRCPPVSRASVYVIGMIRVVNSINSSSNMSEKQCMLGRCPPSVCAL